MTNSYLRSDFVIKSRLVDDQVLNNNNLKQRKQQQQQTTTPLSTTKTTTTTSDQPERNEATSTEGYRIQLFLGRFSNTNSTHKSGKVKPSLGE